MPLARGGRSGHHPGHGRPGCGPARYYDSDAEYRLTIDLIDRYIPDGSAVPDLGAGPGRYSEYMLQGKRCRVVGRKD